MTLSRRAIFAVGVAILAAAYLGSNAFINAAICVSAGACISHQLKVLVVIGLAILLGLGFGAITYAVIGRRGR